MRLLVFLAASAALCAQAPNIQGPKIDELLKKSGAANDANGPKARQYLYREYTVTTELNEKGEPSSRHTETWEAIGLEGSEYRRLVQRDDKPLTSKEQKQEDEKLRKETDKFNAKIVGGIDRKQLENASDALLAMKHNLIAMSDGTLPESRRENEEEEVQRTKARKRRRAA